MVEEKNEPKEVVSATVEASKEQVTKKSLSVKQTFILGIAAMFILVVIGAWGTTIYSVRNLSSNPTILKLASVFNVSVAKVNGINISYSDYKKDVDTLKSLYEKQGLAATDEQISDQALTRLIGNILVQEVAKKYNVVVSSEDVDKLKQDLLVRFNGDEQALRDELKNNYGWEYEDYLERVVKPAVLEQKLNEAFIASTDEDTKKYENLEQVKASHILITTSDPNSVDESDPNAKTLRANIDKENAAAKLTANKVLKRALAGEDFSALAKEFSDDPGSKENGGELGWFGRGQMVSEFEEAAFGLEVGKITPNLVKTDYGYHIIKLEEKRVIRNFSTFMDDQVKNAKFKLFVNIHNPFEGLLNTEETANK